MSSGYLSDIKDQPEALVRHIEHALPPALSRIDLSGYDRVVLTGMGSSHYAAIPAERALAARGLPVLRIDTGQLLDVPQRITANTLLWATSQSGRSGEMQALLAELTGSRRPSAILATTDDTASPLAEAADVVLELRSGPEATVSTKSYLNTLAAHRRAVAALTGASVAAVDQEVRRTAERLRAFLAAAPVPGDLAASALGDANPRFAYVGIGDDAATALTGALITKEAAKVPVEGYVGGAFRHGPLELAGPGLTALLFGPGRPGDPVLPALADDLRATGSRVVTVGPAAYAGTAHLETSVPDTPTARLSLGIVQLQLLTVAFAQATGRTAGDFQYGRKITEAL